MFDLPAALKAAKPGDVITLPPGVYGDVRLSAKFDAPVTLRGEGAIFRSLTMIGCAGVVLEDAGFDWTPTATTLDSENAISVRGCERVRLVNLKVAGRPAVAGIAPDTPSTAARSTSMVIGLPTGRGVYFESSREVALTDSDITGFHRGVVAYKSSEIELLRNGIHDLRGSGLVANGVDDVRIVGNLFSASRPWSYGGNGDHGDFIAIQTVAGQAQPSRNISIVGNRLDQGDGAPIMGVLIGGEPGFENLVVRDNLILGGHAQALLLNRVLSGEVSGNVARPIPGDPPVYPGLLTRDDPARFVISNNHLAYAIVGGGTKNIPQTDGNVYDRSEATPEDLAQLRTAWAATYRPEPAVEEPPADPEVIEIALKPGQRLIVTAAA